MKTFLTFFFIPILFCTSLFGEPLSLVELVDIALKNNPETQKVWWNTKRAQAALGIAKSTLYPDLDATASVNHGREVKFPNGPNTNYTFGSGELCLNYLLFDFGERSAIIQATKDALQSAKWASDFTIQKIVYQVSSNYYEFLNAEELLRSRESSLKDAQLISEAAEDMNNAGLRSVNDLNTSRAAVALMQMDVAQQKAHVGITYGKLMTSMGVPLETQLTVQTMPKGWKIHFLKKAFQGDRSC